MCAWVFKAGVTSGGKQTRGIGGKAVGGMTDHEIIKALGRCPYQRDCVSCDVNACDNSPNHIMKCALSLINRQKAEIDGLQQLVNLSIATQNEMNETIIEQKAEIERLNKANTSVVEHLKKARRQLKTARAEAIKEFAERLKSKLFIADDNFNPVVTVKEIDNLVKEMVGDDNGR